jgi:predicted alpha/beta superfamily hydrolase
MRKLLFMTLIVVPLIHGTPGAAVAQEVPPAVTLPRSQLHQFLSPSGVEYNLYVTFPWDYKPDGSVQYPVLYMLDASGQFLLIAQMYYLMRLGNELPSMILVGIDKQTSSVPEALASRVLDLTPTRVPEREHELSKQYGQPVQSGGADVFLSILTGEIIPWVEARYATSSERGLVGFSFGGLYAAHVLLTAPDSFTHYLIGSPSLYWDNEIMFKRESAYSEQFEDLSARVFLSAGTLERAGYLPNMIRLAERLMSRNYESLQLQSHIFEDEMHLSVIPATFSRGLRFLFEEE